MNASEMARILGQRGGTARARRLLPHERRRIASGGAKARMASLEAASRIEANLRYAAAVDELRGGPLAVRRVSTWAGPLPAIRSEDANAGAR